MRTQELLEILGYLESPHFIGGDDLEKTPGYSHIFRRARGEDNCQLIGVYTLKEKADSGREESVPLIYVCDAESKDQADLIHRRVWNQNIVPFLIVRTPQMIRLYSGFCFNQNDDDDAASSESGVLDALIEFNQAASRLKYFQAESIDDGSIWREWGDRVTPSTRVDWKLLENLNAIDKSLQESGLSRAVSHALIGKYVYLRYLRDRGILSDRKLDEWGVDPESIFSRNASIVALKKLLKRISGWLNGSVFPLRLEGQDGATQSHVGRVAGIFQGDDPDGSLHLNFQAYDFSYIPIETISVIYEQFLHSTGKGKEAGAYYTPIPLVNYILEEMNDRHRLQVGMKVFDPACGSGAFLVQCYRRLVEIESSRASDRRLSPAKLRELLEEHIFGVDDDEDACRVAQLSLTLTLLDYINPPDLQDNPEFRIPPVFQHNIFQGNFFDLPPSCLKVLKRTKFDWIVGNPPWNDLSESSLEERDGPVLLWMKDHRKTCPTGGNQAAEAFAWKVSEFSAADGVVGLVIPAMTLFKDESRNFRRMFFQRMRVWCIVNFANLAEVLFAGRARKPAAVFFYRPRADNDDPSNETILTFAPLVANQEANRPVSSGRRTDTWSIVVNASEVREISLSRAASGESLPWKIAMWGSARDHQLIKYLNSNFESLGSLERKKILHIHEGPQLRSKKTSEEVDELPEVVGKKLLQVEKLRGRGRLFSFPLDSFSLIDQSLGYVRKGRGSLPIAVCRPPHIIVHAARQYAVYSDEYIVVPPRQIGIASNAAQSKFLKALALYLSSKFVKYYEFFCAPQWGIKRDVATLRSLKQIPLSIATASERELADWASLHDEIVDSWRTELKKSSNDSLPLFDSQENDHSIAPNGSGIKAERLYEKLNDMVYESLKIKENARYLIEDLVDVKIHLVDGKVTKEAIRPPTSAELEEYAAVLQRELDGFLTDDEGLSHRCSIYHDSTSAMVMIELLKSKSASWKPSIHQAGEGTAKELKKAREALRRDYGQWLYFDRNLRVYKGNRTYILKPLQRVHWLRSQALIDADEIIADTLAATEG